MFLEVGPLGEAFPALDTLEGLLSGVRPLVLDQLGLLGVTLLTLGALEGSLFDVASLVHHQLGSLGEALAALGALEELLSSVCLLVQGQDGLVTEGFVAVITLEDPSCGGRTLQGHNRGLLLLSNILMRNLFYLVGFLVRFQEGSAAEHGLTLRTSVHFPVVSRFSQLTDIAAIY